MDNMDITEEMTDLRAKKKRPYRISDCVLFKACKEYFHEEEHSRVCDKYTQFICDQANADDETSKKIAQAINIEPLLLNLFLEQEHWSRVFILMYTLAYQCNKKIDEGDKDYAVTYYFKIQNQICQNLAISPEEDFDLK